MPVGHGERKTDATHYHIVDLPAMPAGANSVVMSWKVPIIKRIKLLFVGRVQTSFKYHSVKPMRIDI
jgi:hypothetical protein